MHLFYYGIDGTGPFRDRTYEQAFQNSFVNVLKREGGWSKSAYNRGPSNDGFLTKSLGSDAFTRVRQWVRGARAEGENNPFICLAGYSRGGAAIIHTCNLLKQEDIEVDCLLLFDAVDRSINLSGIERVPGNVRNVYHARRDPEAKSRTGIGRVSFGNCGTSLDGTSNSGPRSGYQEKFYFGTHGAIGGVPWTIPEPTSFADMSILGKVSFVSTTPLPILIGQTTKGLAKKAGLIQPKPPEQNKIKESFSLLPTNVTYGQDAKVALEVWAWMQGNLNAAKLGYKLRRSSAVRSPKPASRTA